MGFVIAKGLYLKFDRRGFWTLFVSSYIRGFAFPVPSPYLYFYHHRWTISALSSQLFSHWSLANIFVWEDTSIFPWSTAFLPSEQGSLTALLPSYHVNCTSYLQNANIVLIPLQPLFFVAPLPPSEFQHSETAQATLTCGFVFNVRSSLSHVSFLCFFTRWWIYFLSLSYSLCWNRSGLHEVVLGTTGRKQGTSAKGALYPSTQSSICK